MLYSESILTQILYQQLILHLVIALAHLEDHVLVALGLGRFGAA